MHRDKALEVVEVVEAVEVVEVVEVGTLGQSQTIYIDPLWK